MSYPAFRFTDWLETRTLCESWYQHFNDKKIPCAVVYDFIPKTNHKGYSVWRIGTEAVSIDGMKSRKQKNYPIERIKGEIVEACHLFKEYLR